MAQNLWIWFKTPPAQLSNEGKNLFTASSFGSLLGFIAHLLFLFIFIALDVKLLAYFNILSILIFLGGFLSTRVGRFGFTWVLMTLEIMTHAALATFIFGLNSGFHLYLYGTVMMCFFMPYSIKMKFFLGFSVSFLIVLLLLYAPRGSSLEHITPSINHAVEIFNSVTLVTMVMGFCFFCYSAVTQAENALSEEFNRSESLLHNILPPPIAHRLKNNEGTIADGFPACSVLFADIIGFTVMSQQLAPERLVGMLNDIFSSFDQMAGHHGLEKIKTIGDSYMVVSGIPQQDGGHAQKLADFAIDLKAFMEEYRKTRAIDIGIRIGLHSGPAVAGVIGKNKFIYDIWGDTVNTAARMESHGRPGEIQVSNLTKELLGSGYDFEDAGESEIKGKGLMKTWLLKSKRPY